MSRPNVVDPVAQRAIDWVVHFHSGEMTDEEHIAFERWRLEHRSHELACQRIEQTLGAIPRLAASPSAQAALRSSTSISRRQLLQRTLSVAVVASASGWLYNRQTPLSGLFADIHTGTAERSTTRLSDGSQLTLNARTSVDVDFTGDSRIITLLKGAIHVVAGDLQTPLVVRTDNANITLNQGTLTVTTKPWGTQVAALSHDASVTDQFGLSHALAAGQGADVLGREFKLRTIAVGAESAWLDGFIQVNNQPLSTLIEALRDYRQGVLRLSDDAASLRISGIFPLDDTDYTLEALAQTMPVIVSRTTGYWISISKA